MKNPQKPQVEVKTTEIFTVTIVYEKGEDGPVVEDNFEAESVTGTPSGMMRFRTVEPAAIYEYNPRFIIDVKMVRNKVSPVTLSGA